MALLKVLTVAKLAILLNCCIGFIYSRPAVQWHWLAFKEKSQNVIGLICTWDGHRHVCPPSPSCSSSATPAALRSSLVRLFYVVTELLGSTPFLIPSKCFTPMNSHPFIYFICLQSCGVLAILAPEDLNCAQELVTR